MEEEELERLPLVTFLLYEVPLSLLANTSVSAHINPFLHKYVS